MQVGIIMAAVPEVGGRQDTFVALQLLLCLLPCCDNNHVGISGTTEEEQTSFKTWQAKIVGMPRKRGNRTWTWLRKVESGVLREPNCLKVRCKRCTVMKERNGVREAVCVVQEKVSNNLQSRQFKNNNKIPSSTI